MLSQNNTRVLGYYAAMVAVLVGAVAPMVVMLVIMSRAPIYPVVASLIQ